MSNQCKGCRASVRVSEESIKKLLEDILRDGSLTLASEDDYIARLSHCRDCPNLDYGTTCRFCGCLVPIRARISEKHCPDPGEAKW
ncbi:MAG: DUF6171 family protein [Armatimonadota bacterium]|nr:DUF6171 family protein [bacterium]